MRIRMLQKVKDAHRVIMQTEKGPEIKQSIIIFQADEVLESNDTDLPDDRLAKLVGYGYAKSI